MSEQEVKDVQPEVEQQKEEEVPKEQPEEQAEVATEESTTAATAAKKKKKHNKKKANKGSVKSDLRLIGGFCDYYLKYGQTPDLTKPIDKLFGNRSYPVGEIVDYTYNEKRQKFSPEEEKTRDGFYEDRLLCLRKGAEVHRQVRAYAQSIIKPGIKLWDLCNAIEDRVRLLVGEEGPNAGCGFPCGVSLNHCAAHYTPNPGDETVLNYNDVMKVDFGVQYHGWIVDCAFTAAFNPDYDNLLMATKEATNRGLQMAGPDQLLGEIGGEIEEIIKSYEVTIDGKVYECKPVANLSGHLMDKGVIHAGKSVPLVHEEGGPRMEEGEVYAIETFATTGNGYVVDGGECSHYARVPNYMAPIRLQSAKKLLYHIEKTFGTIPFCKRYLVREDGGSFFVNKNKGKQEHYLGALQTLVKNNVVRNYDPLCDKAGSYVSQFEHTVVLKANGKEIVSRGDDY